MAVTGTMAPKIMKRSDEIFSAIRGQQQQIALGEKEESDIHEKNTEMKNNLQMLQGRYQEALENEQREAQAVKAVKKPEEPKPLTPPTDGQSTPSQPTDTAE
jgi:hypothetical protein